MFHIFLAFILTIVALLQEMIVTIMIMSGVHLNNCCFTGNDIGRSSYGAVKVKEAFEYAFLVMNYTVMPNHFSHNYR